MAPSLVTWPIKKVVSPVFFASTMIEPEVSRTWAMLPGADGIADENIVCTESMTKQAGFDLFHVFENAFQRGLAEDEQIGRGDAEPFGAHFDLALAIPRRKRRDR